MTLEPVEQDGRRQPLHSAEGGLALPEVVVLINHPLADRYVQSIEAVDPSVRVLQVYQPGDTWAEEWRKAEGGDLDALLAQAEVLFGFSFPIEWVDKMPNLKWVQLASAGSDHMLRAGLLDKMPDLFLTTASGVHEIPISEHIVAMLL